MTNYTVILDACVLYPAPLRSFLLYLAQTGLFRARWSEQIHDEWIRNLLANRPDLSEEKLSRTRELMNLHATDCLVENYEQLIEGIQLPDLNDRHVVAAAIKGQAESIITFNLRDFPDEQLEHLGLKAIHPDIFLTDMLDLDLAKVVMAAQQHRQSLKNPKLSPMDYLEAMQRQKLPSFISKLSKFETVL
jgi:predicted nucleic acid-binding protein